MSNEKRTPRTPHMRLPSFVTAVGDYIRTLAVNTVFWFGLASFLALGVVGLLLLDKLVMPAYTRHDVTIAVPGVENMPFDQASAIINANDLKVERIVQRYNPNVPQELVVDQNPPADARVKPGRTIYLSVNAGATPKVTVPRVEGLALREAKNRMINAGLRVAAERPDAVPSPYENTVTNQSPRPGETVDRGSDVILWYSTGLGSSYVEVPDVVGSTVIEARRALLALKLRSVAVDAVSDSDVVSRQSRSPGTRVREGFEIRLFVGGDVEETDEDE